MSTVGEKVKQWLDDHPEWSRQRLAEKVGTDRQSIDNLIHDRVERPRYLPELAQAMGTTVEQLTDPRLDIRNRFVLHVSEDTPAPLYRDTPGSHPDGMAHPLSHTAHDHPPLVAWETIVQKKQELPARFRCEVPDDALYSDKEGGTRRGTVVVFVRDDAHPLPGVGVLVEDQHGARFIRIYRQGAAGTWLAAARNNNYLTLDSRAHGLQLLAVAEHRLLDGQL